VSTYGDAVYGVDTYENPPILSGAPVGLLLAVTQTAPAQPLGEPGTPIGLLLAFTQTTEAPTPPPDPIIIIYDTPALVLGGTAGAALAVSDSALAVADTPASGGSYTAVPQGLGSGLRITTAIYRASRDNVWLEDISQQVEGGQISVDTTQAVPMTFQAQALGPNVLTPFQDWLAPVITMVEPDPLTGAAITTTQQLGLYMVMPPVRTYTAAQGVQEIDGRDSLWLLASSGPGEPWSRATGQNVGIAMETVCNLAGVRHAVQTTSLTLPKRRTWPWNATWLQIFNDLARSIGFVPAWVDRVGRVRSQRFKKLGDTTPARTISSANGDVLDTVRLEPDLTRLCNHVVVVGNDPKGTPVIAERLNDDPGSPTSTVSLGTTADPVKITKFVEDPNLTDQDAVDALADRLMEQGTSVYVRMSVRSMPVVNWQLGDVVAVDIATDHGDPVASGKWRWERMSMGLGVDAVCDWSMSKLIPYAKVT
jgi:hypothetical protein